MKYALCLLFGVSLFALPAWADIPESPMDVPVEEVLNSPELKAIGFPFDEIQPPETINIHDKGVYTINNPVYEIGRCIVFLYQTGRMREDKRLDTLDEILQKCMGQDLQLYYNPYPPMNIDPWVERNMLTAALVLTAHTGAIRDIAPLLKFNDLNFEPDFLKRYRIPIMSLHNRLGPTEVSSEKRLKRWPAQNALISHATTTVPLLRKAAASEALPQTLRLQAVSYLLYLDKGILWSVWMNECDREFLEKCMRIGKPRLEWMNTKVDEKKIQEVREQNHRVLLFKKKIQGYLDRLIEEENKGNPE